MWNVLFQGQISDSTKTAAKKKNPLVYKTTILNWSLIHALRILQVHTRQIINTQFRVVHIRALALPDKYGRDWAKEWGKKRNTKVPTPTLSLPWVKSDQWTSFVRALMTKLDRDQNKQRDKLAQLRD